MDIFNKLGELALGSRLKRLSDQIMKDGSKVYQNNDINFEPKWFPVFYLLSEHAPLGVTEMSKYLEVSHAAVSQVARELLNRKLVTAIRDENDGRKRLLSLSPKGKDLLPRIREIWNDIAIGIHEMLNSHQTNIIDAIREVEMSFSHQSLDQRVAAITLRRCLDRIEVIPYDSSLKKHFRDLNYGWITKYFELEGLDEQIINNPDEEILDKGGKIIFAKLEGKIVGTCALIKIDDTTYELAKMAVDEAYQGRKVGKKLGLHCINLAKELGAKKIILESNKKLRPAINLYQNLGFVPVCIDHHKSIYQRANISMQLELNDQS